MNKLESLQYQAGLAVTGMWQGTNRDRVYEELGWESLHMRRWFRRLTVFYKIVKHLTPQYLRDPVPSPRSHLYGTSNTNDLHPFRCRTQRFLNSFFPDAVKCWNNIGPEIRKLDSLSIFKSTITKIIKPKKKNVFNVHNPNLKYLYQLRGGLSSLKAHKFRHKFDDTPNPTCSCGTAAESTRHFLLDCPAFTNHREKLLDDVNPFIAKLNVNPVDPNFVNILLYGNDSLTIRENKAILESTLAFISNSGRFLA